MADWFTVETIDKDTFAISEYRHWEETHCGQFNNTFQDIRRGINTMVQEIVRGKRWLEKENLEKMRGTKKFAL